MFRAGPLIWWLFLTVYRDLHKEGGLLSGWDVASQISQNLIKGFPIPATIGTVTVLSLTTPQQSCPSLCWESWSEAAYRDDGVVVAVWRVCFINNVKWPAAFLFWRVFTVIMIISMLLSFAILESSRVERCQLGMEARKKQVGRARHMVTFLLWLNAQVKIFLDIAGGSRQARPVTKFD